MKKLGIIAALPSEASCLDGHPFSARSFPTKKIIKIVHNLLIVSGIGSNNATAAAEELIKNGAQALISWGTAGGLSPNLKSGDVLIPDSVQTTDQKSYKTDSAWRRKIIDKISFDLKVHNGLLIQTNDVIKNPNQRYQLHKITNAIAVDMESGAIAKVAGQNNIPFLIIRTIVDPYNESIPNSALSNIDQFGRAKILPLIGNLLRKPTDIPKLITLGSHFNQARKTLQHISQLLGSNLPTPEKIKN